jgi:hypothetical protein
MRRLVEFLRSRSCSIPAFGKMLFTVAHTVPGERHGAIAALALSPLIHEETHETSRLLLLVKNKRPKKLKRPNVLDSKQLPTRSGMQGLYERTPNRGDVL